MTRMTDDVVRSAMAGASTGGRTFTALAAQAFTARADAPGQPDALLATPRARRILGVLALGELIADKLPVSPSRLELPGMAGRVAASAACGAIIARREPDPLSGQLDDPALDPSAQADDADELRTRTIVCAVTGVAVALVTARGGVRWRAACSRKVGRGWVGATVEDVAVVALAVAATRA